MVGLSKYSVCVILLTVCALFLVTMSLTMFWYQYSEGDGTTKLAIYYRETPSYSIVLWDGSSVATVMSVIVFVVILWFLAALVFIGLLTSGDMTGALKTAPVLAALGIGMLAYFILRISDAVNSWPSPTPRLSGFFSSSVYEGTTYTGGPAAGFFVALLACGSQVIALTLYLQWFRTGRIDA